MLGLRFFGCLRCQTVHADPGPPERCGECGATRFEELTAGSQASEYFSRADDADS